MDSVIKATKPAIPSPLAHPRVEEEEEPSEEEPRGRSAEPNRRQRFTGAPLTLKDMVSIECCDVTRSD